MSKLNKAFIILIAVTAIFFACIGAGIGVYAEEEPSGAGFEVNINTEPEIKPVTPETNTGDEELAPNLDELADSFTAYLKDKYGAEYELYYNAIIEQWGSVEGYLLAFGEKLPEKYQSGWDKFVGWLNTYAPVWSTMLAVVFLVVAVVLVKRAVKKLKEWSTALIEKLIDKRLSPIENELNLQSKATVSVMRAQRALMGTVEKFRNNVNELEAAEKELTDG